METTAAFTGLACVRCDRTVDPETGPHRCPDCDGALETTYDYDAVDLDRETLASRSTDSMWRFEELLPFTGEDAVSMDEGATPLVECPALADWYGVDRVLVKDEGRNPTGSTVDRGLSVAVTAARARGADTVALPSTGDAGQSAAAYAARGGLEATVYLPARSSHTTKAMVNVHGGEMTVSGGRYPETVAGFADDRTDEWHSLAPFDTPYRLDGAATLGFECFETLDWTVPDAIVHPTGHGLGLLGVHRAATALTELGWIDEFPSLYAAQATGCAPVVDAFEAGEDTHEPVEHPDTICGAIEIPDPKASDRVLTAIRESGGGAVATEDPAVLESALVLAEREGLTVSPSAAAAASAGLELGERGELDPDATVVLVASATGNKEADVLRSHLMTRGV